MEPYRPQGAWEWYPPEQYAFYQEKKQVRRVGNAIGGAFLIGNAVTQLPILLMPLWPALWHAFSTFYQDPMSVWMVQIVLSTLMFTIPFVIGAKLMGSRAGALVAFGKPKKELLFPLVLISFGCCMLGNIASQIASNTLSNFGIFPKYAMLENPQGPLGVGIVVLGMAFLPALLEEFALRGVVLGGLRRFGDGFAIMLSAAFFGLMHGNLVQMPFAFITGVGLGLITVLSESVWPAILIHCINNFGAVVLDYLQQYANAMTTDLIGLGYYVLVLALGVLGAVLLLKRKPDAFTLAPSTCISRATRRTAWLASAPVVVIILVIYGLETIAAQVLL